MIRSRHEAYLCRVREKSRLKALLNHFSIIDDPREPWRVAYPSLEVLLLVVCSLMANRNHYDAIAGWGEANLALLIRYLPYEHGAPGGRWLTLLMNRIDPNLFSAALTAWVHETWPQRPDLIAIDGKTSHHSHDRGDDTAPAASGFRLRDDEPSGVALDAAFDHADHRQMGKARFVGVASIGEQPVHVMADAMAARFDAA